MLEKNIPTNKLINRTIQRVSQYFILEVDRNFGRNILVIYQKYRKYIRPKNKKWLFFGRLCNKKSATLDSNGAPQTKLFQKMQCCWKIRNNPLFLFLCLNTGLFLFSYWLNLLALLDQKMNPAGNIKVEMKIPYIKSVLPDLVISKMKNNSYFMKLFQKNVYFENGQN